MYKIEIDWKFKSPFLKVVSGIVRVDNINMGMINKEETPGFPFKKEQFTLGYQNGSSLSNRCQPLIDLMVRSYYDGLIMRNESCEWFRDCYRKDHEIFLTMND